MPNSASTRADLDSAELDLLDAMADEGKTIDAELAACFWVVPKPQAARTLIRLERLGFLVARDDGRFSLNRAAYAALVPREPASNGHRHYK